MVETEHFTSFLVVAAAAIVAVVLVLENGTKGVKAATALPSRVPDRVAATFP